MINNLNTFSTHLQEEITQEQFDLLKCEFCDDHIKKRFSEMKEIFYKIFKNSIKFVKLIKNKDEVNLKKLIEENSTLQKDYLNYRSFIEKLILFRKNSDKLELTGNKKLKIEGLSEKEKNDFFEELNGRKEVLKKFMKNIIELENISKNIHENIELFSLSNTLINN